VWKVFVREPGWLGRFTYFSSYRFIFAAFIAWCPRDGKSPANSGGWRWDFGVYCSLSVCLWWKMNNEMELTSCLICAVPVCVLSDVFAARL